MCSSYSQSHLDERISLDLRTRGDGSARGTSNQLRGQLFSAQISRGNPNISITVKNNNSSPSLLSAVPLFMLYRNGKLTART